MYKYLKGFVACLIMLALLYVFFCSQVPSDTASIKQVPDWIEGTLLLTTRGSGELAEKEPIDKYVCAFDFDNDTISTVEIPSNAELMKDMYTSKTVFFFNAEGSHQSIDYVNGNTENRWWRYRRGDVTYAFVEGEPVLDRTLTEFVYELGERPIAILGSGKGWKDFYLLRYGVADVGEPEIQLCLVKNYSTDNESLHIIHRFPDNYDFSHWNYAISEDSKIAWLYCIVKDWDHLGVAVSDTGSEKYLFNSDPDDQIYGGIAWLNEDTLLYISDTSEYDYKDGMLFEFTVMQWHLDSNTTEPLTGPDGCNFTTESRPEIIAVNDGATCIALYCAVESGRDYIMFISPQTGKTYKFFPWPEDDNNPDNLTHKWYGKSDDGIVFYEPQDMLEPEMIWHTK